jgi:multicomponent Na+:H+ antiporter subunit D
LFVAFSVKLGLFPFHFWLPAVYTGTRPAVAAILSGALANIGSYGLLRFGADILPRELGLGAPALLILGSLSIVYGALQAVSRHVPGEALAYSAIGQVGYVLIALGLGGPVGYAAAILVTVVNSLSKTLLFLSANLRGWLVGAAFAVGALSVVGVPPAVGFLAKVALLRTSLSTATTPVQITMVALIVVGGALAFVYMFQIYQRAFWLAPENVDAPPSRAARRAVVVLLASLILALGLWPEPLLSLSEQAANVLPERGIP